MAKELIFDLVFRSRLKEETNSEDGNLFGAVGDKGSLPSLHLAGEKVAFVLGIKALFLLQPPLTSDTNKGGGLM